MMEDDDDQGLLRDEGEEDSSDPFYTVRAELRGRAFRHATLSLKRGSSCAVTDGERPVSQW